MDLQLQTMIIINHFSLRCTGYYCSYFYYYYYYFIIIVVVIYVVVNNNNNNNVMMCVSSELHFLLINKVSVVVSGFYFDTRAEVTPGSDGYKMACSLLTLAESGRCVHRVCVL